MPWPVCSRPSHQAQPHGGLRRFSSWDGSSAPLSFHAWARNSYARLFLWFLYSGQTQKMLEMLKETCCSTDLRLAFVIADQGKKRKTLRDWGHRFLSFIFFLQSRSQERTPSIRNMKMNIQFIPLLMRAQQPMMSLYTVHCSCYVFVTDSLCLMLFSVKYFISVHLVLPDSIDGWFLLIIPEFEISVCWSCWCLLGTVHLQMTVHLVEIYRVLVDSEQLICAWSLGGSSMFPSLVVLWEEQPHSGLWGRLFITAP